MDPHLSSEQSPDRPASSASPSFVRSDADDVLSDGFGETLTQLRRDVASLKATFGLLASQAGGEAVKTMRNMSETVASQVGETASGVASTGSDFATSAKRNAKTLASELEAMARRNPLGAMAGTLMLGIIVGMISRGRG